MNGIIGMTELALETSLTTLQREYLGLVKSSAESLLTVINDILDFSKIEAGKLDLEEVEFGLRGALEDTIWTLAQRAHSKNLELACRIAPDIPDDLIGDPGRLRQILVNLVGNAIKFTERGEVVVSVQADPDPSGQTLLRFSVADTGIGIPANKQSTIFEAFVQADGSTTRRYGGTGLGLSISTKLVSLMEGRIWVEGAEGQGSTFHFTSRFGLGSKPEGLEARGEPESLKGLRVLIVDDNHTNRRILEELLGHWGAIPSMAIDGPSAIEALRSSSDQGNPFDIALIDGMMPGMDGFDLAGRIVGATDYPAPVMIMLTSSGMTQDKRLAMELGIKAYLTKPVRHSELFDVMRNSLRGVTPPQAQESRPVEASAAEPAPPRRSMRILLAEDHPVNQKVAVCMLQGMGYHATVVPDGRRATEAWATGAFDLILMDVQMPEMDGFEAVALIRSVERTRPSGGRIPIVALTAHAMKGDRERCLGAGFDDYLCKPIRSIELRKVLEKWSEPTPPVPIVSPTTPIEVDPMEFDHDSALEILGGDEVLLREILALFMEDCPRLMSEIEEAIDRSDADSLKRLAHTMRGVAGNFALKRVVESAMILEANAKADSWGIARETFDDLRQGLDRVFPSLEAVISTGA